MITIYAIHRPDAAHLARVMQEMASLGAPRIKVVECGDHYAALEGSHRLAAAHEMGLTPLLDVLEQDDPIDPADFDWEIDRDPVDAGSAAGDLFDPTQSTVYQF